MHDPPNGTPDSSNDAGRRAARHAAQPRDARAARLGAVHAQSQAQAPAAPRRRADALFMRGAQRWPGLRRVSSTAYAKLHARARSIATIPRAGHAAADRAAASAFACGAARFSSDLLREDDHESLALQREPPIRICRRRTAIKSIRVDAAQPASTTRRTAPTLYDRYLDEWLIAEEEGLDIMLNEHHQTATCVDPAAPLMLAALARLTKKARLLILGNPIANRRQPVRVAEEMAMIDVLSHGRARGRLRARRAVRDLCPPTAIRCG